LSLFIWGGFLKKKSENIPKAPELANTSVGTRRDGGVCESKSLFVFKKAEVKCEKMYTDRIEAGIVQTKSFENIEMKGR
jgi:hypothetical protein